MMAATFARLFVTSKVAHKRSPSSNNLATRSSALFFRSATAFMSEGDKAKKAVSEADEKAESNKNSTAHAKAMIASTEGGVTDAASSQPATEPK